jgi:hypothetical protein
MIRNGLRRRVEHSRFARYGIVYGLSIPFILWPVIMYFGPRSKGWGQVACIAVIVSYVVTGFVLLAWITSRPWMTRRRGKPQPVLSEFGPPWDRQVDG